MSESPLDDILARQYAKYPYPNPTRDLVEYERSGRDIADPGIMHRLYWPDREYPQSFDILIAGCGANQAADIAYHNRGARVLGIDVSETSLGNERFLRDKHNLTNLELLRLPIEEIETLGRDFDLIISTGVLHHMANPQQGMNVLAKCLRPHGVAAIYLYGKYGRIGIEIMQELFLKRLKVPVDDAGIAFARHTLDRLPHDHPMKAVLWKVTDFDFDGGIVDELLGARERSYTVEECFDFIAQAGLVFQGWGENAYYYPEAFFSRDTPLYQKLAALPELEMWAATDLTVCNPGHYFLACRPDRPKSQYAIDFTDPACLNYRPLARESTVVLQPDPAKGVPAGLQRHNLKIPLSEPHALMLNQVDGRRDLRAVAAAAGRAGLAGTPAELEAFARTAFETLWRLGMVVFRLPSPAA